MIIIRHQSTLAQMRGEKMGLFFADLKGQAWAGKIIQNHYSWTGSFNYPEGNHSKLLIIWIHHTQSFWEGKGWTSNRNPIQKNALFIYLNNLVFRIFFLPLPHFFTPFDSPYSCIFLSASFHFGRTSIVHNTYSIILSQYVNRQK